MSAVESFAGREKCGAALISFWQGRRALNINDNDQLGLPFWYHQLSSCGTIDLKDMAAKSICRRCLKLATSTSIQSHLASPAQRGFAASASRTIHQSSRNRAGPITESARPITEDISAYTAAHNTTTEQQDGQGSRVLLRPNNLFHSYTNSPSPAIRKRAAFMRQNAYCPHPDHQATRAPASPYDLEARKTGSLPPAHVRYECPDCGIPVSCSEEHFASDYENHLEICHVLREINEDDHDLQSGRFFAEFDYPGSQIDEAQVNLMNWDTMLYSREFQAINDERSMRQVTRLLTYPVTIASVLHELSPYGLRNGVTAEGLRSLTGKLGH